MNAAEVPDELVEVAYPAVLALFEVCAMDDAEEPNGACVYCREEAENYARHTIAAVLPRSGAMVLEEAAAFLSTKNLPASPDGVDVVEWLSATAARLRAAETERSEP